MGVGSSGGVRCGPARQLITEDLLVRLMKRLTETYRWAHLRKKIKIIVCENQHLLILSESLIFRRRCRRLSMPINSSG